MRTNYSEIAKQKLYYFNYTEFKKITTRVIILFLILVQIGTKDVYCIMVEMTELKPYKGIAYGKDGNLYKISKIKKQDGNRWKIRIGGQQWLSQLQVDWILLQQKKK
jgi:hypothetical protein